MQTYEQLRKHKADFIVAYRMVAPEDGGREVTYQHLRCDFLYEEDDPQIDGMFMSHPEFLDGNGRPLSKDNPIPLEGRAAMWILIREMRRFHQTRIELGAKGFFMEGHRRLGAVEVLEIVGLHENPTL